LNQTLIDFQTSFTDALDNRFAITLPLQIPPRLKRVADFLDSKTILKIV